MAETGNKRTNITDEDVTQCIKDLSTWFQTNALAHYEAKMAQTANVATADEVNACLNEFGASQSHLVVSLQKFNGGMHYTDTYIGLGLNEIKQIGTEKGLIARNIVPIAKDIDDSLLSV